MQWLSFYSVIESLRLEWGNCMYVDARFRPKGRLSRMLDDKARAAEAKSGLLAKLKDPKPSQPAAAPKIGDTKRFGDKRRAPRSQLAPSAPPLGFFRLSDPDSFVEPVSGMRGLIEAISASAVDQVDRTVFAWPEPIRSPLGASLIAALNLHEGDVEGGATMAFYSYGRRAKFEIKRLFIREREIAQRALARITTHDRSLWSGPGYHFDYLLHATASSDVRKPKAGALRSPVLSPNLFETVPVFEPSDAMRPYPTSAENFLAELGGKRELLKDKPEAGRSATQIDDAPVCLFGLPEDEDLLARCRRSSTRLSQRTDVVVVDLSRPDLRDIAGILSRLRKLKKAFAGNVGGRPAFVVVCADPFLTLRCRELLADVQRAGGGSQMPHPSATLELPPESLRSFVKTQALDFAEGDDAAPGDDVPNISVLVKNEAFASLRERWLQKAREIQKSGYAETAVSIRQAVGFLQTIASLPVGYAYFAQSVEGAEEERRLNSFRAARC